MILTRAMPPELYGQFLFIQSHFITFVNGLDFGASQAMFTYASRGQADFQRVLPAYIRYVAILVLGLLGYFFGVCFFGASSAIWPGIAIPCAALGLVAACLLYIQVASASVAEAAGLVGQIESAKMARSLLLVGVFALLYWQHRIGINSIFVVQIVGALVLMLYGCVLSHRHYATPLDLANARDGWTLIQRFVKPLLVYSGIGLVIPLLDRWLLQKYGGSSQQAYYGVCLQICSFIFLAAGSTTSLFQREVSKLAGSNDNEQIGALYVRTSRYFFFGTAVLAIFFSSFSGEVLTLIGGPQYAPGKVVGAVLMLYPIHQVYGQLSASVYYSTDRVKQVTTIGITTMLCTLVLSYLFIVWWDLGALGLAIKMVAGQLIEVLMKTYFNAKYLRLDFFKSLLIDCKSMICLIALGFIAEKCSASCNLPLAAQVCIGAILYFITSNVAVVAYPNFVGIESRGELFSILRKLGKLMRYKVLRAPCSNLE